MQHPQNSFIVILSVRPVWSRCSVLPHINQNYRATRWGNAASLRMQYLSHAPFAMYVVKYSFCVLFQFCLWLNFHFSNPSCLCTLIKQTHKANWKFAQAVVWVLKHCSNIHFTAQYHHPPGILLQEWKQSNHDATESWVPWSSCFCNIINH